MESVKTVMFESRKKNNSSSYKHLRDRFIAGQPPTNGQSNDYFFQAAIQCNTDGLAEAEAGEKIRVVYDKWRITDSFSDRPWSNIETKIQDVYENNMKIEIGRKPTQKNKDVDRVAIVFRIIGNKKIVFCCGDKNHL